MTTETITPEIVTDEVAIVVKESGLALDSAQSLQRSFADQFRDAKKIIEASRKVVVTDASDKLSIKIARECRLELRAVRVASDKLRKSLKEDSLRQTRAIDGFYNVLLHLIEPEENRLKEQEEFLERQEAARKAALKVKRESALSVYGVDTTFFTLAEMSEEAFSQLLENSRLACEARLAAARRAEEDRLARTKAEAEERARIAIENERLKREAFESAKREEEERKKRAEVEARAMAERRAGEETARKEREAIEAKARAEKAAADALANIEREARKKAERELAEARAKGLAEEQAKENAERLRIETEQREAKCRELAPDREKVTALARTVRALEIPALSTEHGKRVHAKISEQAEKFAAWLEKLAGEMEGGGS